MRCVCASVAQSSRCDNSWRVGLAGSNIVICLHLEFRSPRMATVNVSLRLGSVGGVMTWDVLVFLKMMRGPLVWLRSIMLMLLPMRLAVGLPWAMTMVWFGH